MKIHPQGFQNRVSGCLGIPSSSQIHPRAPREAQKVRGRPPKVDFWGPGPFLEFRPGPPKTRFGPHRVLLGGSGMPKWSHFHPPNGAGSEKRDFLEILLKPKRQLDFQGPDPPKIDPKSIPEAIRKQARKKSVKKVRGRLPKS